MTCANPADLQPALPTEGGGSGGGGGGGGEPALLKGETVLVVGTSSRRGHLLVQRRDQTVHVPHQYLELKGAALPPPLPAVPPGKL